MRVSAAIAFLLVSFLTAAARATSPTDSDLARALFTSGKEAMARGDLPTACARFAESVKLDPLPGARLNLANCQERSGRLVSALSLYEMARGQLQKGDGRIAFATERIDSLTRRIPRVVVALRSARGTSLRLVCDDVVVDTTSGRPSISVDPGRHVIVVEEDGAELERTEVTVAEGQVKELSIGSDGDRARTDARLGPNERRRTAAYVTGGIAVAGLLTGAVTGIMTMTAASTYRDHCRDGACDERGLSAAKTGEVVSVVSPVALVVGAALAATSLYLFLSSPTTTPKSAASPRAHTFDLALSSYGGEVMIRGRF